MHSARLGRALGARLMGLAVPCAANPKRRAAFRQRNERHGLALSDPPQTCRLPQASPDGGRRLSLPQRPCATAWAHLPNAEGRQGPGGWSRLDKVAPAVYCLR